MIVTSEISCEYFSKLNKGYDKWFSTPFSGYVRKQQFKKFLEFTKKSKNYLEIGCGTGQFISKVNCKKKVGVDISKNMIDTCKEKGLNAQFLVAPSEKLPFSDNSFECVGMMNVFQYLENPESTIEELYRVTRPGGKIMFSVFSKNSISFNPLRFFVRKLFGENLPNVKFYNPGKISQMLKGKKFSIEGSGIRPPFESRLLYRYFWKQVEKYENVHHISPYLSVEMFVYIFK